VEKHLAGAADARPNRGGRPKGSPNKRSLEVADKLAALGCDPLEGMARIAMDKTASLELRGKMFAELAQYVAPKRKAVEHTGAGGGPVQHEVNLKLVEAAEATLARLREGRGGA
jgi:hypothetical protein